MCKGIRVDPLSFDLVDCRYLLIADAGESLLPCMAWIMTRWWNAQTKIRPESLVGAALAARDQVVNLAGRGRGEAAGGGAVLVPEDHGAAQVRGDGVGGGADIQGQADAGGWRGEGAGAQHRREPAGAGQQRGRVRQDQVAPCVPVRTAAGGC